MVKKWWLSFLFRICGLRTLSCDFVPHSYETLKWLSSPPTLMQVSFWWWQCSDRYIISLSPPPPYRLPPFSPSLISLMVSVDVKHHVYLLTKQSNLAAVFRRVFQLLRCFGSNWIPPRMGLHGAVDGQRCCIYRGRHWNHLQLPENLPGCWLCHSDWRWVGWWWRCGA